MVSCCSTRQKPKPRPWHLPTSTSLPCAAGFTSWMPPAHCPPSPLPSLYFKTVSPLPRKEPPHQSPHFFHHPTSICFPHIYMERFFKLKPSQVSAEYLATALKSKTEAFMFHEGSDPTQMPSHILHHAIFALIFQPFWCLISSKAQKVSDSLPRGDFSRAVLSAWNMLSLTSYTLVAFTPPTSCHFLRDAPSITIISGWVKVPCRWSA